MCALPWHSSCLSRCACCCGAYSTVSRWHQLRQSLLHTKLSELDPYCASSGVDGWLSRPPARRASWPGTSIRASNGGPARLASAAGKGTGFLCSHGDGLVDQVRTTLCMLSICTHFGNAAGAARLSQCARETRRARDTAQEASNVQLVRVQCPFERHAQIDISVEPSAQPGHEFQPAVVRCGVEIVDVNGRTRADQPLDSFRSYRKPMPVRCHGCSGKSSAGSMDEFARASLVLIVVAVSNVALSLRPHLQRLPDMSAWQKFVKTWYRHEVRAGSRVLLHPVGSLVPPSSVCVFLGGGRMNLGGTHHCGHRRGCRWCRLVCGPPRKAPGGCLDPRQPVRWMPTLLSLPALRGRRL